MAKITTMIIKIRISAMTQIITRFIIQLKNQLEALESFLLEDDQVSSQLPSLTSDHQLISSPQLLVGIS